jgi:hypothetical protein
MSRVWASTLPNGSSIRSSSGSTASARDADALFHPPGELRGIGVGEPSQPDEFDHLLDAFRALLLGNALLFEAERDVSPHGAPREQPVLQEYDFPMASATACHGAGTRPFRLPRGRVAVGFVVGCGNLHW